MTDPFGVVNDVVDAKSAAEYTLGAHPKLFIFIASIVIILAVWVNEVFAEKKELSAAVEEVSAELATHVKDSDADIRNISNQIEALQQGQEDFSNTVKEQFLLQDIARIDSEIYDIETLEAAGEILPRDRQRLVQLRSMLNEKRRQLNLVGDPNSGQ